MTTAREIEAGLLDGALLAIVLPIVSFLRWTFLVMGVLIIGAIACAIAWRRKA